MFHVEHASKNCHLRGGKRFQQKFQLWQSDKGREFADPKANFCLNDVEPIPIKTIGAAKL
jgi:hypothetical protein